MRRWLPFLLLTLLAPGLWAGGNTMEPQPCGHEIRNGSLDPAGYVDGYSLYIGYFVPNLLDPTGNGTIEIDVHKTSHEPDGPRIQPDIIATWDDSENKCDVCEKVFWRQYVSSHEIWWVRSRGIWGVSEGYETVEDGARHRDGGDSYFNQPFNKNGTSNQLTLEDQPGREGPVVAESSIPRYKLQKMVLLSQDLESYLICKKKGGGEVVLGSVNWGHFWQRDGMLPEGKIRWTYYPAGPRTITFSFPSP